MRGGGSTSGSTSPTSPTSSTSPALTSISPTSGPAAGGTAVTLAGANLTGATAVNFGSTPATGVSVNNAGTSITATSPAGTGAVSVSVVTPNGTSNAEQFTYSASSPSSPSVVTWCASGCTNTTSSVSVTNPIANIDSPAGIAVDGNGNIWFANSGNNSVTELQKANNYAATTIYNGSTHFSGIVRIAVDSNNNIWLANSSNNSVTELTASSGYSASSAVNISGGTTGFNGPYGIAIDGNNNIWIADAGTYSSFVTELTASNGYSASGAVTISLGHNYQLNGPIAVDGNDNIWIGGNIPGTGAGLIELTKTSGYNPLSEIAISGGSTGWSNSVPNQIAIDESNNIWTTDSGDGGIMGCWYSSSESFNEFSGVTVLTAVSNYASTSALNLGDGGANSPSANPAKCNGYIYYNPAGIAVDGSGNIWVANSGGDFTVVELTKASNYSTGSAVIINGGGSTGLINPQGVAVDASGNVWITSNGSNTITELVGAAAPTPFSVPLK